MKDEYKILSIKCKGSIDLELDLLKDFQGNLKTLSQENYNKFKNQLLELGFSEPISVWNDGQNYNILNGHQRVTTLKIMQNEGFIIPKLPCNLVEAKDRKEAKKKVLALTSQYGEFSQQGINDFMIDSELELKDLDNFTLDLNFNLEQETENTEEESCYTDKVTSPIYEPKGDKPALKDLYDLKKYQDLKKEIESSNLPEAEKEFLLFAATRHIIFNYEKIAEYYSHSSEQEQDLIEKSALVIIDYDKAIENGFVKLTEDIKQNYIDELEDSND